MPRYWSGTDAPTTCNLCEAELTDTFIDGATLRGGWAFMCALCHAQVGIGLGTGRGQQYTRQADGRWLKTGG